LPKALVLRNKPQSKRKASVSFVIAVVGAIFAVLDLHGWHVYAMFGVLALVVAFGAVHLTRVIREREAQQAASGSSLNSRGG